MRIQDSKPNVNSPLTTGVESTRPSDSKSTAGAVARGRSVDQVHVSAEVGFAKSTIAAAISSPDVRPAVVARAEALLAAGKIGADAESLADSLINAALNDSAKSS